MTEDFAKEGGQLEMQHYQETLDADLLLLSGPEESELTFTDFSESSEMADGHDTDSVNITRDERYVNIVNDDDFYILNDNDPSLVCLTEEHQSAMNLFAKAIPYLKKSGVLNNIYKFLELVSDDIFHWTIYLSFFSWTQSTCLQLKMPVECDTEKKPCHFEYFGS